MTIARKNLVVTGIMITIFCTMSFSFGRTAPTVIIYNYSGYNGEIIVSPIFIVNATNIMTATINLSFESSIVQIVSMDDSVFDNMIPIVNNTEGWTRIGAYQIMGSPLSNTILLANITFYPIGNPSDYSPLNFTYIYLENNEGEEIPFVVDNGSFTIREDLCQCQKGDCNQDCDIDIFDFDLFGQAWGKSLGDPHFVICHDFNNDDMVNVFDLDEFAQAWGIIYCDCLPCMAPPWQLW